MFKLGLRFLTKSISKTQQSNLPWHVLKALNWFSFKRLLLPWASKKYRLSNNCAQQCVDEGVGLCSGHNLHRTDHMKNGKQHTAYSQLTA